MFCDALLVYSVFFLLTCQRLYWHILLLLKFSELYLIYMLVVRDKTKKYDCKSLHLPSVFKAGPIIQSSQEKTGCDWIHDGDMFLQAENKSSAPRNWSWTFLTSIQTVEDRGWPHYPWMPDGHISSLKVSSVKVGKKTISYKY